MSEVRDTVAGPVDVGEYCRKVEEHLARVNEGHLVRVVGPGFDLARGWAESGVPLAVVYRGIERKAERHRAGRSTRPLRLEFCESDVREEYEMWRRAVGVPAAPAPVPEDGGDVAPVAEERRRRPAVGRALERAIEKLVRAAGRLDASAEFRDEAGVVLAELVRVRDDLRHVRGDARAQILAGVGLVDRQLAQVGRRTAGAMLADVEAEAIQELAPFRSRLTADAWQRSLDASIDRLLRDRLGLPTLDMDAPDHPVG